MNPIYSVCLIVINNKWVFDHPLDVFLWKTIHLITVWWLLTYRQYYILIWYWFYVIHTIVNVLISCVIPPQTEESFTFPTSSLTSKSHDQSDYHLSWLKCLQESYQFFMFNYSNNCYLTHQYKAGYHCWKCLPVNSKSKWLINLIKLKPKDSWFWLQNQHQWSSNLIYHQDKMAL